MFDDALLKRAEQNDVEAICELAEQYYLYGDENGNYDKAMELYSKAKQLDPENDAAALGIGNCYRIGVGVFADVDKGTEYILQAAKNGYAKAQFYYGMVLENKGSAECMEWYEKAYNGGYKRALTYMASLYFEGNLVEEDVSKAIELYKKGVEENEKSAILDYGAVLLNGNKIPEKNTEKGIELMKKAAELRDGTAESNLSKYYFNGAAGEPDIEEAEKWARRAAEDHNAEMLNEIGVCYYNGDEKLGIAVNKEKAYEIFSYSAKHNGSLSIGNAGVCCLNGFGTEKDIPKAIEWFEKGTRIGIEKCVQNLEGLYQEQYSDGGERFVSFLEEVSKNKFYYEDREFVFPLLKLHFCYRDGTYVKQDIKKANEYLESAVKLQHPRSCALKALYMCDEENGYTLDKDEVIRLLETAVKYDYPEAFTVLGDIYFDGKHGVESDKERAIELYRKGDELGNALCTFRHGCIVMKGLSVEKDEEKGLQIFERAAERGNVDALVEIGNYYHRRENYLDALNYFMKAFFKNNASAAFMIACYYKDGKGVEKNINKAIEMYEFAGKHGKAEAYRGLVICYEATKQFDKCIEAANKAKEVGLHDADGLIKLAEEAEFMQSEETFIKHHLSLAENGNIESMAIVGDAYRNGNGITLNKQKALEWFSKAAQQGNIDCAYSAGYMLAKSEGVLKDPNQAVNFLNMVYQSDSQYSHDAGVLLSSLYSNDLNDDLNTVKIRTDLAEKGDVQFQVMLGLQYLSGEGVPVNVELARDWFEKAALQGDVMSTKYLMDIYSDESSPLKNIDKSEHYAEKVIDLDTENEYTEEASLHLAYVYSTFRDKQREAVEIWKRLAQSGRKEAQFNLGLAYYNGRGIKKDLGQAINWWKKAADQGDETALENYNIAMQEYNKGGASSNESSEGKSGCYVATAVYGSYDCPQVWTLRRFRDYILAPTWYGRSFIKLYYSVSPTIVKHFGQKQWFNNMWRPVLDGMVKRLNDRNIPDTPYEDKVY